MVLEVLLMPDPVPRKEGGLPHPGPVPRDDQDALFPGLLDLPPSCSLPGGQDSRLPSSLPASSHRAPPVPAARCGRSDGKT